MQIDSLKKHPKKIILLIIIILLLIPQTRRAIVIKEYRAYYHLLFDDLYTDLWKGQLDASKAGATLKATFSTSKTYRYALYINGTYNRQIMQGAPFSEYRLGKIKYTILHDGKALHSETLPINYGYFPLHIQKVWFAPQFVFWMPYEDKYETIDIEIEVLEPDPLFNERIKSAFWSISGHWNP